MVILQSRPRSCGAFLVQVHHDLKPQNMVVTDDTAETVLVDFGTAAWKDEASRCGTSSGPWAAFPETPSKRQLSYAEVESTFHQHQEPL